MHPRCPPLDVANDVALLKEALDLDIGRVELIVEGTPRSTPSPRPPPESPRSIHWSRGLDGTPVFSCEDARVGDIGQGQPWHSAPRRGITAAGRPQLRRGRSQPAPTPSEDAHSLANRLRRVALQFESPIPASVASVHLAIADGYRGMRRRGGRKAISPANDSSGHSGPLQEQKMPPSSPAPLYPASLCWQPLASSGCEVTKERFQTKGTRTRFLAGRAPRRS